MFNGFFNEEDLVCQIFEEENIRMGNIRNKNLFISVLMLAEIQRT